MSNVDLEVRIQIVGLKWYVFKVSIAKMLIELARRLIGYNSVRFVDVLDAWPDEEEE